VAADYPGVVRAPRSHRHRLITRIAAGLAIVAAGPAVLVAADLAGTWAAHPAAAAEHAGSPARLAPAPPSR
jgi:hypothetical protein